MITQDITQCDNKVTIETAENLNDAKENNFNDGEYSRYYVNGKLVSSYISMIKFIVDESQKNPKKFIPENALELRNQMISNQSSAIMAEVEKLKEYYASLGTIPPDMLKELDNLTKKIDLSGVRIKE